MLVLAQNLWQMPSVYRIFSDKNSAKMTVLFSLFFVVDMVATLPL